MEKNKKNSILSPFAITMLCIIVSCNVVELFVAGEWPLSIIRIVAFAAAVLGVANVVLSSDGSIWNYIFGLPTVICQGVVALYEGNIGVGWMDLAYLVPMQVIGFFMWTRNGASMSADAQEAQVKGRRLNWTMRTLGVIAIAIASVLTGMALKHFGATSPWLDGAAVVMQIVAQLLMTFAFMEQWAIWIVVNTVYLGLWTHTMIIHPSSNAAIMIAMWFCYFIVSIHGFRVWHRISK